MDIFWAVKTGKIEEVEKWIKEGHNIDEKDPDGWTPLMFACVNGYFEIAKKLLEAGANANEKDKKGDTSLLNASFYGLDEIVELLIENEADVNLTGVNNMTPLMEVLRTRRNAREKGFKTVRLLIQSEADIRAESNEGITALKYAVQRNEPSLTLLLMKHGKQMNENDQILLKDTKYKMNIGKYSLESSLW